MSPEELQKRTFDFSLAILPLFRKIKSSEEGRIIGRQLLRSATSVAANYRAARRSRSKPDFYSKINIVLEEADESLFWLEYLKHSDMLPSFEVDSLLNESLELVKIFSSARSKMRGDT